MTDLLERTPVQDVLLDERKQEPTVELPPREERGIERPTEKRPVRWLRWMIGALVLIVAATVATFALSGDGTSEVLDTDGSFQANETRRMEALAPTSDVIVIDLDGSFQANETRRMEALAPTSDVIVIDLDGSFQANETRRMEALAPTSDVIDLDGSFQANEIRRMESLRPTF